jgi:hypothetical protein
MTSTAKTAAPGSMRNATCLQKQSETTHSVTLAQHAWRCLREECVLM